MTNCSAKCLGIQIESYTMFNLQENKEGLELLKTAIAKAGYTGKASSSISEVYASIQLLELQLP